VVRIECYFRVGGFVSHRFGSYTLLAIRAARLRGEKTGLTDEERAFYDALAENQSARQVMGKPALRVIAQELVASIKRNVSVAWMHREAAPARIRPSSQIRLSPRLAGCRGAERLAAGRGALGGLGGVIQNLSVV
jgi:Domain of unknown function (DUF3387)